MNNKLIHSFYSEKCNEFNMFMYSCYFTLSCLYVVHSGGNISIHTDSKFAELIDSCPYKNIYVDLDNCYEAPRKFFAYAKLKALEKEPLGTIHIDGDVFLKDKSTIDLLNFSEYDCIVQHLELRSHPLDIRVWDHSTLCFNNTEYPYYMNRACNKMYNCGVLAFNNEELFKEWHDNYFRMLNEFICRPDNISDYAIPDIIIEQQSLTDLCDYKNYKVKTLLHGDTHLDISLYADKIYYQHIVGDKMEYLVMCLQDIKKLSKSHYEEIKSKWEEKYPIYFKYVV